MIDMLNRSLPNQYFPVEGAIDPTGDPEHLVKGRFREKR